MRTIKIARDYSDTPLGRYPSDGEYNGSRFRDEFMRPALEQGPVAVDIDDAEGYGSSFLEEAFGGLVRGGFFTAEELKKRLTIEYKDEDFKLYHDLIWRYITEAKKEKGA
ncbi:MAG TPA: STAS-like domain-containing protein [Tepidisphaeraceae bacterium]|jgi:hypothetical protein